MKKENLTQMQNKAFMTVLNNTKLLYTAQHTGKSERISGQ